MRVFIEWKGCGKREKQEEVKERGEKQGSGCNIVIPREMFSFCSRVLSNTSVPKNISKPIPAHNWHIWFITKCLKVILIFILLFYIYLLLFFTIN